MPATSLVRYTCSNVVHLHTVLVVTPGGLNFVAGIIGLSVGSTSTVITFLATRHFGMRNFGVLYGTVLILVMLGFGGGPVLAGLIYDQTGSYTNFFGLAIMLLLIGAGVLLSFGPPPVWEDDAVPPKSAIEVYGISQEILDMLRVAIGIIGMIVTWAYRPPSGLGDAIMMMGEGQSFYLKEPVFLGLMAAFGLIALFGLIAMIRKAK